MEKNKPNIAGDIGIIRYEKDQKFYNRSNFGHCYSLPKGMAYESDEAKSYLAGSYSF